jgi:hypothetical protein
MRLAAEESRMQRTGFSPNSVVGGLPDERVLDVVRLFARVNIMTLAVYMHVSNIVTELNPTLTRLIAVGYIIHDEATGYFTVAP